MIIPNIIGSLFYIWERDWRTNFVEIIDIKDNKVIKTIYCSVDYLEAQAMEKIIAEDLSSLSVEEFEEKHISAEEKAPTSKELIEKLVAAIIVILIVSLMLWMEISLFGF